MANAVDPRIAPKEMIVTRNKSAQQRRKLREKDRSMTKITQLLKSPQSGKKKVKSPNGKTKKRTSSESEKRVEYHPDKLRRRIEEKRVFLRPQYESKTVVKLNKRKLGTPQKNMLADDHNSAESPALSARSRSPAFAELSMEELVRLVEDTESLDDEDFMEILTCPSPVWWEGPPDENYVEEAICQGKPTHTEKQKKPKKEKVKQYGNKGRKQKTETTKGVSMSKKDANFKKKQSKLESLLGNIKRNVAPPNKSTKENAQKAYTDRQQESIDKLDANGNKMNEESNKIAVNNIVEERKDESLPLSNDSEADPSSNEDALLIDLENMDIPMEVDKVYKEHANEKVESCLELRSDPDLIIEEKLADDSEVGDMSSPITLNMPSLTKRPKLDELQLTCEASYSDKSDLSSVSTQENCDTISDTNIKFIADEDIDDESDTTSDDKVSVIDSKNVDEIRGKLTGTVLDALNEKNDYITVYRILQTDKERVASKFKNIPEYSSYVQKLMKQDSPDESKYDGQLNSFFKKCKNANRKRKREVEPKVEDMKKTESQLCDCDPKDTTISIAQDDNVKYCLNCSSIFDTDECSYCLSAKSEDKNDAPSEANLT